MSEEYPVTKSDPFKTAKKAANKYGTFLFMFMAYSSSNIGLNFRQQIFGGVGVAPNQLGVY